MGSEKRTVKKPPPSPQLFPSGDRRRAADGDHRDEPLVRLAALVPRGLSEAEGPSHEQRTGALIRRAALPEGLNADRLDRVWDRLARRSPSRAVHRPALRLRWAFLAGLLLSAGAMAATGTWRWPGTMVHRLIGRSSAVPSPQPDRASPRRAASGTGSTRRDVALAASQPPMVTPVGPPPSPMPVTEARASHPPLAVRARAAPRPLRAANEAPSAPPAAQLAEESQFVSRALVRLRQSRDSDGALAELDRYAQRFPAGILEHEALSLRVDALLVAGRPAEARTILARLTLASTGRDRELRLIRAELATDQDCAAALDDYRIVWNAHPEGRWGERALWGQAVCAARLGDEPRARVVLTRYLAQFPDGPHAGEARDRLHQ